MEMPESGTFKAVVLPGPQTTVGRCFGVVDLGTVDNTFPGKVPKRDRKVVIMWELPKLRAVFSEEKGEQPFMVMEELKLSPHPDSNFSKLIAQWRNKPLTEEEKKNFPIEKMLNKIGLISIQHKTKVKFRNQDIAQVTNQNTSLILSAISPVPEEMKAGIPAMHNEGILWLWEDITKHGKPFDKEKFEKIFKFLRTKIYTSDEFKACPTAVNIDTESANTQQAATSPAPQPEQGGNAGGDDDW